MTISSFIEHSKVEYSRCQGDGNDDAAIKMGCLQRIANACELMAKDRERMESQLRWDKHTIERLQRNNDRLARSNAAYRGMLKKLKAAP